MGKIADFLLLFAGIAIYVTGVYLLVGLPVALIVLGSSMAALALAPDGTRYKPPRGGA